MISPSIVLASLVITASLCSWEPFNDPGAMSSSMHWSKLTKFLEAAILSGSFTSNAAIARHQIFDRDLSEKEIAHKQMLQG
jgi:hypothetical protein